MRNEELGFITRGYPVGFTAMNPSKKKPQRFLYNHARIIVRYNEDDTQFEGSRIVGFEVYCSPSSANPQTHTHTNKQYAHSHSPE